MEIPVNTAVDTVYNAAVERVINGLQTQQQVTITRSDINHEQAKKLCDAFYAKGYHHEIRIHSNNYGAVFFYCVTISKIPYRSKDAMFGWSEYVR